eukprot:TRINITY_DN1171_c0_g6_i1.p1 TRINITY_DN1171_c0_g6~~TRINITY_DN1171_c0_g6_i1.p1  ORF type:complete len:543 (+),score=161.59 TRINITY_DN1171_c0_g6_i1:150-1778(+)
MSTPAKKLVCKQCSKEVAGGENYVSIGGETFHEKCYQAPKCFCCHQDVRGSLLKIGAKVFHPGCFICHRCQVALSGSFCTDRGLVFCPTCFKIEMSELELRAHQRAEQERREEEEREAARRAALEAAKVDPAVLRSQIKNAGYVPYRSNNPNAPFYDSQNAPDPQTNPASKIFETDPLLESIEGYLNRIGLPNLVPVFAGMTVMSLARISREELLKRKVSASDRAILLKEIDAILEKHPELQPGAIISPRGVTSPRGPPTPTPTPAPTPAPAVTKPAVAATKPVASQTTKPTVTTTPAPVKTTPAPSSTTVTTKSAAVSAILTEKEKQKQKLEALRQMREKRNEDNDDDGDDLVEAEEEPAPKPTSTKVPAIPVAKVAASSTAALTASPRTPSTPGGGACVADKMKHVEIAQTVEQRQKALEAFLELVELSSLKDDFVKEEVDLDTLFVCTEEELKGLHFLLLGHRKKIVKKLKAMEEELDKKETLCSLFNGAGILSLVPLVEREKLGYVEAIQCFDDDYLLIGLLPHQIHALRAEIQRRTN